MQLSAWLVFTSIALATAFSPGPAVLFVVSNALAYGPRRALCGSAGNVVGVFIVATLAATGLGLLLRTSALAFSVLKLLGALYLAWLGIRQWRSRAATFARGPAGEDAGARAGTLFRRGVLVSATNPKAILFFTALLPLFIPASGLELSRFLLLTGTFAACTVVAHVAYALLASAASTWLASDRRVRAFNRVAGATFVGLGVGVLRLRPTAV